MKVAFETFQSDWRSWDHLFTQAAEFASSIEPEDLITISHSSDNGAGIVTVWYWTEDEDEE